MTGWIPVDVCTLPTEQQPLRAAEFDDLLRSTVHSVDRREATWLRLGLYASDAGYERATGLIARESACCSFFEFDLQRTGPDAVLDIRVPAERVAVLDGLHQRAVAAAEPGTRAATR